MDDVSKIVAVRDEIGSTMSLLREVYGATSVRSGLPLRVGAIGSRDRVIVSVYHGDIGLFGLSFGADSVAILRDSTDRRSYLLCDGGWLDHLFAFMGGWVGDWPYCSAVVGCRDGLVCYCTRDVWRSGLCNGHAPRG